MFNYQLTLDISAGSWLMICDSNASSSESIQKCSHILIANAMEMPNIAAILHNSHNHI